MTLRKERDEAEGRVADLQSQLERVVGYCLESRKQPERVQAAYLRDMILSDVDPYMNITGNVDGRRGRGHEQPGGGVVIATLTIPEDVIEDLASEVLRAQQKFPNAYNLNAALMEEVGELASAQMQQLGDAAIRKEAIQVMAMAFRIMNEGDASLTLNDEAKQK